MECNSKGNGKSCYVAIIITNHNIEFMFIFVVMIIIIPHRDTDVTFTNILLHFVHFTTHLVYQLLVYLGTIWGIYDCVYY